MSDLLSIGISGISAYRNALDAIGENVSNAQTPGYTRRRIALEQVQITSRGDIGYGEQILFNGVRSDGVVRAWDDFKATEARYATTGAARAAVREQWLTSVENTLGDGVAGVGASLTAFFNAANRLAADPTAPLGRTEMLTALDSIAGALRNSADGLGRIASSLGDAVDSDVDRGQRRDRGAQGSQRRDARRRPRRQRRRVARRPARPADRDDRRADRRRRHDQWRRHRDPEVAQRFQRRAARRRALRLVQRQRAPPMAASRCRFPRNGTTMPAPVTGGRLAGLVDVAASVADRHAALDALAADVATTLNTWSAARPRRQWRARRCRCSTRAAARPGSTVAITDPDRIAAATADGRPNGNLIDLEAVRAASKLEERWGGIVSGAARQLATAKAEAAASAAWRDLSRAALDEVTGVDLDQRSGGAAPLPASLQRLGAHHPGRARDDRRAVRGALNQKGERMIGTNYRLTMETNRQAALARADRARPDRDFHHQAHPGAVRRSGRRRPHLRDRPRPGQ